MVLKAGVVGGAFVGSATLLEKVAGTLGLVAGIIVSLSVIVVGTRHLWHFTRNVGRIVENTAELPGFMVEQRERNKVVSERLASGDERMARIEGALNAYGTAERAAVSAAIEATTAPRQARRTDPAPRTGWRE